MNKYVIWHVQGGLGKNVAATALVSDIKKIYSDRKLVMVVSWPEVFLQNKNIDRLLHLGCLLYTSPSPRDPHLSRMPSSA